MSYVRKFFHGFESGFKSTKQNEPAKEIIACCNYFLLKVLLRFMLNISMMTSKQLPRSFKKHKFDLVLKYIAKQGQS